MALLRDVCFGFSWRFGRWIGYRCLCLVDGSMILLYFHLDVKLIGFLSFTGRSYEKDFGDDEYPL